VVDIQRIIKHLSDKGIGVLITDHNVRETLEFAAGPISSVRAPCSLLVLRTRFLPTRRSVSVLGQDFKL